MRLMLTAAALALSSSALAQQSSPDSVAARIRRVEHGLVPAVAVAGRPEEPASIEERMRHYHVPGVSIAVVNDGRIEWARGYGVTELGGTQRVDTSTLFLAGSISKPVAATGALWLVEHGKLSLDEPVNAKLTTWKVPENDFTRAKPVTLRLLLSHSAGMTVHGFPGYEMGKRLPTIVQVLNGEKPANTAPVRVDIPVGSQWRYSGGGITVAQLLMQDVTGEPFPEVMRRTVLVPAGMVHSTYENPLPASRAREASSGHEKLDTPVPGRYHVYPEMAAAGLWTTASDLARWIAAIQRSYNGDATGILSPAMTREMLTVQKADWGLGIQLRGAPPNLVFTHGGRDEGFVARLVGFANKGQGFVVMTNGVSDALIDEIARSIRAAYGLPLGQRPTKALASFEPRALDDYVGSYTFALGTDTITATVARTGDQLVVTIPGQPPTELLPEGPLAFFAPDNGAELEFGRDGGATSGPATSLALKMGGGPPIKGVRRKPR